MRATISPKASILAAKIQNNNGRLSSVAPITLKNQIQEIRSIEDILDVEEVDVTNGATLIYNSQNDKYEVRQLSFADLSADLDGGSF
jgi:hypothetical protein